MAPKPRIRLRRVAIVSKPHVEEAATIVRNLVRWLGRHGIDVLLEETIARQIRSDRARFPLERPPREADLMIVLGGDGTLLSVARAMGSRQLPVLGVNVGSLGFLTDVALKDLYRCLESIREGRYEVDPRMMLDAEIVRKGELLRRESVLNDVVVTKGAIARIIELGITINDQFVAMMRADGLIVSTPTGSTAYNLAAGGPILYPGLGAVILTPICPHTLTYRPVVVSDRSVIELTLRSEDEEVYATFDGQASERIRHGDVVRVKKGRNVVRLVSLPGKNFFQVLRYKLRWAERPRNRRPGGRVARGRRAADD